MNHIASTEKMRDANEALARGDAVRFGDKVWDLSVARFHGLRDDGVFVPVYLDGMADADEGGRALADLQDEAKRLRSAGFQVL